MSESNLLNVETHDERDPNPWLALYLDNSIPINQTTKEALMRDNDSRSAKIFVTVYHDLVQDDHVFHSHL